MNNKLTILLFVTILSSKIYSQKVSLSVDTASVNTTHKNYKYFDINRYEQKTVFKAAISAGSVRSHNDDGLIFPVKIFSVERKLSKPFSLEGLLYVDGYAEKIISAKLRFYPNKRADRGINNISGNYFALEYAKNIAKIKGGSFIFNDYLGSDRTIIFQYGKQMKSGNFGYADFKVFVSHHYGGFFKRTNIGFNALVGAAWGRTRELEVSANANETKKTLKNGRIMFSMQNPNAALSRRFDQLLISVGCDVTLFRGLTINTKIMGSFGEQRVPSIEYKITAKSIGLSGELRQYLLLNTQRQRGRTINSFEGVYASLGSDDILSKLNIDIVDDDIRTPEKYRYNGFDRISPYFGVGYQERAGKKFFFDVYARYYHYTKRYTTNKKGPNSFVLGATIGMYWLR